MISIWIDDVKYAAEAGERLIDVLNRSGVELSQVCYHPQLGPTTASAGNRRCSGMLQPHAGYPAISIFLTPSRSQ
jgi:hypothetical protein